MQGLGALRTLAKLAKNALDGFDSSAQPPQKPPKTPPKLSNNMETSIFYQTLPEIRKKAAPTAQVFSLLSPEPQGSEINKKASDQHRGLSV